MKSVLLHSNLSKVTCGRVVKEENDSAGKKALFDEKALASKMLSAHNIDIDKTSQINHIKHCETAWQMLGEIYTQTGPARRICLFKQLLQIKMCETDTVGAIVTKFYEMVEILKEVDQQTENKSKIICDNANMLTNKTPANTNRFKLLANFTDESTQSHLKRNLRKSSLFQYSFANKAQALVNKIATLIGENSFNVIP